MARAAWHHMRGPGSADLDAWNRTDVAMEIGGFTLVRDLRELSGQWCFPRATMRISGKTNLSFANALGFPLQPVFFIPLLVIAFADVAGRRNGMSSVSVVTMRWVSPGKL